MSRIQIVMTASVAAEAKRNRDFAACLHNSIGKFRNNCYGVATMDAGNLDPQTALGIYIAPSTEGKLWIKADPYPDDLVIWTILFPSEY